MSQYNFFKKLGNSISLFNRNNSNVVSFFLTQEGKRNKATSFPVQFLVWSHWSHPHFSKADLTKYIVFWMLHSMIWMELFFSVAQDFKQRYIHIWDHVDDVLFCPCICLIVPGWLHWFVFLLYWIAVKFHKCLI